MLKTPHSQDKPQSNNSKSQIEPKTTSNSQRRNPATIPRLPNIFFKRGQRHRTKSKQENPSNKCPPSNAEIHPNARQNDSDLPKSSRIHSQKTNLGHISQVSTRNPKQNQPTVLNGNRP